jgi:hypothetical protein
MRLRKRYTKKDMIEFANFAKSYQSNRYVKDAFEEYEKGKRLSIKNKTQ